MTGPLACTVALLGSSGLRNTTDRAGPALERTTVVRKPHLVLVAMGSRKRVFIRRVTTKAAFQDKLAGGTMEVGVQEVQLEDLGSPALTPRRRRHTKCHACYGRPPPESHTDPLPWGHGPSSLLVHPMGSDCLHPLSVAEPPTAPQQGPGAGQRLGEPLSAHRSPGALTSPSRAFGGRCTSP